ncbi:MAG TPA: N-acylneuraminate-9-phosphate synthase [Ignavibacteria bacterium]|nr:N-acylneuraminate-9-phosphate synthase [Ignavibacteria bacterium]
MGTKIKLHNKIIGEGGNVYIIAEAGVTHFGDLTLAKKQIDVAISAGCDAVKFQKRDVASINDEYWRKRLEYKELSEDAILELRDYSSRKDIDFFVTPHDIKSLDFVNAVLDTPFIKVGSGESLDVDFLHRVGSCKKPVIVSFGLHLSKDEIKKSVRAIEKGGTKQIILLHCNTIYPTQPHLVNLGAINEIKQLFPNYVVGYSDHTLGWHIPLAAVTLGASVIEKHISFDKNDNRSLDCSVSCEPEELKLMVHEIRDIEKAIKQIDEAERNKEIMKARGWVGKMTNKKLN